jgi:hypothetical protein
VDGFYVEQRLAAQTKAFTYFLWSRWRLSVVAKRQRLGLICSAAYKRFFWRLAMLVRPTWIFCFAACFNALVKLGASSWTRFAA